MVIDIYYCTVLQYRYVTMTVFIGGKKKNTELPTLVCFTFSSIPDDRIISFYLRYFKYNWEGQPRIYTSLSHLTVSQQVIFMYFVLRLNCGPHVMPSSSYYKKYRYAK